MGRFSDWSEKTKTFFTERSRNLLVKNSKSSNKAPQAPMSLAEKLSRIRRPVYFLLGLAVAALLIEITFQFILPTKSKKPLHIEVVSKRSTFLQARSTYDGITQKNIFCPGCAIPNLESRKVDRPKDCNKADRLGGGIKLIGTIVLSNANYSVATLAGSGPAKSYRVGDRVESYGTVFEIRRDRICILKSDDKLAYIELPGVPRSIEPVSYGAGRKAQAGATGIAQVSDTEYEVKRDFLMKSLTDMSVLQTAYATPYFEDNEIKGFRIQSIDPGSPLLSLGLRPNDILQKADNQPLTSIAKAQEILAGASSIESLVITVLRNGEPVNLTYKVGK